MPYNKLFLLQRGSLVFIYADQSTLLQALRQSLLKKYARIRSDMDRLHNQRLSPYEKIEALESIRCQIQGSWRTDEIRRQKPSPQVPEAGPIPTTSCIPMHPVLLGTRHGVGTGWGQHQQECPGLGLSCIRLWGGSSGVGRAG